MRNKFGFLWTATLTYIFSSLHLVYTLRMVNITGPDIADSSNPINLHCHYDMESDQIYSVKWYKDNMEFFRYVPHEQPQYITFKTIGVHPDTENSKCDLAQCKLRLNGTSRINGSGIYACEVTSEAPSFKTIMTRHNLTVVSLPKQKPKIVGAKSSYYKKGIRVVATCVSSESDPIAIINWYINKKQVPSTFINETKILNDNGLGIRSASLHFQLNENLEDYEDNTLKLRCVSSLPGISTPPQEVTRTIILEK